MSKNDVGEKELCREEICKIVGGIENTATLKFILSVIKSYLKSRGI